MRVREEAPTTPAGRPSLAKLETSQLFQLWRDRQDRSARDEIVHRFLPLARRLARRYRYSPGGVEDLEQVAAVGLLNAIERFEPDRGTPFRTFAIPTIIGELKRYFRDTGWAVHVPRQAQEHALQVDRAVSQLTATHGRSPCVDQIAQYLEISTEEALAGLNARTAHFPVSLDIPARCGDDGPETSLGDTIGDEDDRYALVDTILSLAAIIPTLPFRQRQVLSLRLQENLMQTEIASRIGCSQMQVSRLLRDAAAQLRATAMPHESV